MLRGSPAFVFNEARGRRRYARLSRTPASDLSHVECLLFSFLHRRRDRFSPRIGGKANFVSLAHDCATKQCTLVRRIKLKT
jgi:hypothetical protein